MKINTTYNLGDILYHKTDPEQLPGIVVGIVINPGSISYILSFAGEESEHFELELSEEMDVIIKTR